MSLKVGLKPETNKRYNNLVSIVNGETLRLPCVPPGARGMRLSWTLPSGVVLDGPQVRGRFALWENGTLTVRDASVFDRGTYVCNADGEHGPSVVSIPVIVIADHQRAHTGHLRPPRQHREDELHGHGHPQSRDKLGAARQVASHRGDSAACLWQQIPAPAGIPNRPAGHPERRGLLQMHCKKPPGQRL